MSETLIGLGEIARRMGLTPQTVRYHFQVGHIPEPQRRGPSGARLFTEEEAQALCAALSRIRLCGR